MYPCIEVDLRKIRENAKDVVAQAKVHHLEVACVTKSFCATDFIVEALIDTGIKYLADSRVLNLKKMSRFPLKKMLLRIPMLSELDEVAKYADVTLISEIVTIQKLNQAAQKLNRKIDIILMIDVGDLREGIFETDEALICKTVEAILECKNINFLGIGTNLTCYGARIPTTKNMTRLVRIKKMIETKFHIQLSVISGANSSLMSLYKNDMLPHEINQIRVGSAIVLGIGLNDLPIEGLHRDAFKLKAEVVEVQQKPSVPVGEGGLDAFGGTPVFVDRGIIKHAICAIGRQDVFHGNIFPCDKQIEVLGSSSDHLILDVTKAHENIVVGSIIEFDLSYGSLLSLMTSPYVQKVKKI